MSSNFNEGVASDVQARDDIRSGATSGVGNTRDYGNENSSASTYDNSSSGDRSAYRSSSYNNTQSGTSQSYDTTREETSGRLGTDAPLEDRMSADTGGAIKPIVLTEEEKKVERQNDHHGTASSFAEKISNALDFPGINSSKPPAQTRKGL